MSITVIVPISPVKSHPDTTVLDETLDSVRFHLPDVEIFLLFDGVRDEQEQRRNDYEEFIRRALWRADKHYKACAPYIFNSHQHQVGMLRYVLDDIRTDLMLFVESDAPLVVDEPIDWDASVNLIQSGEADVVRYSHEGIIPKAHRHMMLGLEGDFMRTCQYSGRPHLASVAYYRRLLQAHFSPEANCFLEDVLHSVCHQAYEVDGMTGWHQHRLWLYHPQTGNIKRSYTTDGRAGEPKWDDTQVF